MVDQLEPGLVRLNEGISQALKNFRVAAKLSQSDLAKMAGINQSVVSRLERQCCDNYSLSTLFRIFDKLNLDIRINFVEKELIPVSEPIVEEPSIE